MEELSHPAQRITWIINEYYSGKDSRFAAAMGITPAAVPKLKAEGLPSFKVISGILSQHPDINPDWLILGNGPTLRSENTDAALRKENKELRDAAERLYTIIKNK